MYLKNVWSYPKVKLPSKISVKDNNLYSTKLAAKSKNKE